MTVPATAAATGAPQSAAAEAAIQRLLIAYARALDYRDWPALQALFTDDVHAEYGGIEFVDGRDNLIAMIRRYLDGCGPTQHLLGNFCIAVEGGRAASACYVRGMHAGTGTRSGAVYDFWGEYRDQLVLTPGGWRIRQRVEQVFHHTGDIDVLQPAP